MKEINRRCDFYERMDTRERKITLKEKVGSLLGSEIDKREDKDELIRMSVVFLIGSVVSDGCINEREYLYIYPALVDVYGREYDFNSIKEQINADGGGTYLKTNNEKLKGVCAELDEAVSGLIVDIYLLIVCDDGKITFEERKYINEIVPQK